MSSLFLSFNFRKLKIRASENSKNYKLYSSNKNDSEMFSFLRYHTSDETIKQKYTKVQIENVFLKILKYFLPKKTCVKMKKCMLLVKLVVMNYNF